MSFLPCQPYDISDESLTLDLSSKAVGSELDSNPMEVKSRSPIPMQPEQPNLIQTLEPKSIQWQSYLRPLWWVSLGLHLLVLRFPFPVQQHPLKVVKSVKITKLTAVPPVSTKVQPVTRSTSQPKTIPGKTSVIPRTETTRVIKSSAAQPISTPKTTPSSPPTPTPIPTSTPKSTSTSEKTPLPVNILETELKSLIVLPKTETACGGSCYETKISLDEVATKVNRKLSDQGWGIESISVQDSTRKIFKVSKPGLAQVLNILTRPSGIVVYALADQEISLKDLNDAENSLPAISDVLGTIKGLQPVDASYAAQANLFEGRGSNIESTGYLEDVKPGEAWKIHFEQEIRKSGFEFSIDSKAYGGGPVYVIKRPLFTHYLNLVPSEDGSGTVIVLWKNPPA